jgi:hypothetical protein
VIPHIDDFMEDGYTKEEWKVLAETKKMLDPKIKVTCTAVRVPVFIGHSESVNIEFENESDHADEAREILREAPGSGHRQARGRRLHHALECAGEDATFISRIREDATVENGLNIWVVSDNLRKGAALNTVQIAEKRPTFSVESVGLVCLDDALEEAAIRGVPTVAATLATAREPGEIATARTAATPAAAGSAPPTATCAGPAAVRADVAMNEAGQRADARTSVAAMNLLN